jgi:hypothetical protein
MWRPLRIVLIACIMLVASAMPAAAATTHPTSIAALSALWYKVLTTPDPENPFGSGGTAKSCLNITPSLLAPFGPGQVPSCTAHRGTYLVVTPWTTECSTFESPGENPLELRTCAEDADAGVTNVRLIVDHQDVHTDEVDTVLLNVKLPADNLFGLPAGSRGQSVGHGWVAVLRPMAPGTHVINLKASGTSAGDIDNTTKIIVERN